MCWMKAVYVPWSGECEKRMAVGVFGSQSAEAVPERESPLVLNLCGAYIPTMYSVIF